MTESSKPAKRRRGRPSKISRDQVLEVAKSLSAEQLTMPAVAGILGVKTPALYHHFSSREALVGELGQMLFSEMVIPAPDPAHWRAWLHAINMQLYRFLTDNPLLIEASDSAQGFLSLTLRLCESILETLQKAGFAQKQSYWIMISLTQIAYSAARNQIEGSAPEAGKETVREQIPLVGDKWPRTAAFMQHLPEQSNHQWLDQLMHWSIECIPEPSPQPAFD